MRLQELYIKDYKVLQDFTLTFDEQSAVSVLIGENGSGKTTVVECLTLIFVELFRQSTVSDLYKSVFPFEFRLRYVLSTGPQVGFDYEHENRSSSPYIYEGDLKIQFEFKEKLDVRVEVDGSEVYNTPELISQFLQAEGFSTRQVRYILPNNVVLYYSGISKILERIFDNYQDNMILSTLDGEMKANPDLFYFKSENFPALLIGLLSFQHGDVPEKLENDFQILKADPFDRIVIQLSRPQWAKARTTSETFWGAKGDLANFLAVLRDRVYKNDVVFDRESITFTIRTRSQLNEIWSFYGQEKSLFEYLITLQANGLIKRIDVDLRKDVQLVVPYQRLSEGEKQVLIIMALRELLATDENGLFLLDEPDTYLHPEWKRKFIADFQSDKLDEGRYLACYLITTHSPGIVSGMRKNQLHILRKVDGRSEPKAFSFNPYGKTEDDILFDFFGIAGLRYKPIEDQLNELQRLITQGEYESETFKDLYQLVENQIDRDDKGLIRLKLEVARHKRAAQPE